MLTDDRLRLRVESSPSLPPQSGLELNSQRECWGCTEQTGPTITFMKHSIPDGVEGHSHYSIPEPRPVSSMASQPSSYTEIPPVHPSFLRLVEAELPAFEAAMQRVVHTLKVPISTVGIPQENELVLKPAIGPAQLGLKAPLAEACTLPLADSLVAHVLQEKQSLVVPNIADHALFSQSLLAQQYGVQAFLGVPLITTTRDCLGLIIVMDVTAHVFSAEAIACVEFLARWSVGEYERYCLSQQLAEAAVTAEVPSEPLVADKTAFLNALQLNLMSQLTQDMHGPLTTIAGMANMLSREIYGALTPKQREYVDIVYGSSQVLLEMTSEVLELSKLGTVLEPMRPTTVDFELLGQHVQKTLTPIAEEASQTIQLTVEPGSRLWTVDKDSVRQLLYHLTLTVIKLSGEGGTVRIHGSDRNGSLNIAIWVSHPWLGEGLPNTLLTLCRYLKESTQDRSWVASLIAQATDEGKLGQPDGHTNAVNATPTSTALQSRELLSLLLSRHLIERHSGKLTLQGSSESDSRLLVIVPPA